MQPYEERAHKIIAELSYAAWDKANPKHPTRGRPKKHRPYHVPELAQQLVTALGIHDEKTREHDVKALLLQHNSCVVAHRAVACKHWRWMPGMAATYFEPGRIVDCRVYADFAAVDVVEDGTVWDLPSDALPDLRDPATIGCLLALVREAWEADGMAAARSPYGVWFVEGACLGVIVGYCDSEAEALVAALEAAP